MNSAQEVAAALTLRLEEPVFFAILALASARASLFFERAAASSTSLLESFEQAARESTTASSYCLQFEKACLHVLRPLARVDVFTLQMVTASLKEVISEPSQQAQAELRCLTY